MVYETCTADNVCACVSVADPTRMESGRAASSYLAVCGVRVCGAARTGAGAAGASIPMHGTVTHIASFVNLLRMPNAVFAWIQ